MEQKKRDRIRAVILSVLVIATAVFLCVSAFDNNDEDSIGMPGEGDMISMASLKETVVGRYAMSDGVTSDVGAGADAPGKIDEFAEENTEIGQEAFAAEEARKAAELEQIMEHMDHTVTGDISLVTFDSDAAAGKVLLSADADTQKGGSISSMEASSPISVNIELASSVTANDMLLTSVMTSLLSEYQGEIVDEDDMMASSFFDADEDEYLLKAEDFTFYSTYVKGMSDPSVAYIQQRLMELGFMDDAEPTEYYGSITMEAVKRFQRQNDLKEDGIVGAESLAMLVSEDAQSYIMELGMTGEDIEAVQWRLYELGYLSSKTYIDGSFGSETQKAVISMQSANELLADGRVGQMTLELMYSDTVKANIISFGDNSTIVKECQERLKELGYLTTKPDGNYGSDTLAAVKLFQSRNGLVVDGYLGPTTREMLDSGSAVANGLVIGDEGDTVKRVQTLLIKYGYMNSGSDTGYFGEVTEKAVKKFQRANGLSADGNVGSKTMAVLTGSNVVAAWDTGSTGGDSGTGGVDTGVAEGSVAALLEVAMSKLGCKYVYGAKGPNTFDCSGFVYWCLNQVGVKQSYITSYGWRTVGKYKKITSYSDLKAGDIIVVTGHVGIIAENGMIIDASSSYGKIVYRSLSSWFKNRFICGWRIFD